MELTDKYDFTEGTKLTWPLKLLFFIGGVITMSSMLGFFFMLFKDAGQAAFGFFGLCMLVGAIAMTRMIDSEKLILAVGYPLFLAGHIFFNIGIIDIKSVGAIVFINICVLAVEWLFCRNHFMRQVILLAILILIPLIFLEIHDRLFFHYLFFYYAILLLGVYGLTIIKDADKCDKDSLYACYIPTIRFCAIATSIGYARTASIIDLWDSFREKSAFSFGEILEALICATFTFVVTYNLLSKQMQDTKKYYWSLGLIIIGCLASCISPEIALALLGLVLTYTVLDYFGLAISGLFLIFALSVFYYDLDISLIYKSYLLMGSGIVFLSLFYFIKKLAK